MTLQFNDCTWFYNVFVASTEAAGSLMGDGYAPSSTEPVATAGSDVYICGSATSSITGAVLDQPRLWVTSMAVLAPEDSASDATDDTYAFEVIATPEALVDELVRAGWKSALGEFSVTETATGRVIGVHGPQGLYELTLTGTEPAPDETDDVQVRIHQALDGNATYLDATFQEEQRMPYYGFVGQATGGALAAVSASGENVMGASILNVGRFTLEFER